MSIEPFGTLQVNGTLERPVVFTPESRDMPWGSLLVRTEDSVINMTGAILTGSGANDDWFDDVAGAGSSHRDEQACIYVRDGTVTSYDTEDGLVTLRAPARRQGQAFVARYRVIPTIPGTLKSAAHRIELAGNTSSRVFIRSPDWKIAR